MSVSSIKKRKLRSLVSKVALLAILFVFTLGVCLFASFVIPKQRILLMTPLAAQQASKMTSEDTLMNKAKNLCDQLHLTCSQIRLQTPDTLIVNIDTSSVVYLSTRKDIASQLGSLQVTRSQLTIEGKRFKTLDFRFEKPVITF